MQHRLKLKQSDLVPFSKFLQARGWSARRGKGNELLRLTQYGQTPVSLFRKDGQVMGFDKARQLIGAYLEHKRRMP